MNRKVQVWECKIVIPKGELPPGFDAPPRQAVINAIESAGIEVIGCSSGWGGSLTEDEIIAFDLFHGKSVYIAGLMDTPEDIAH